MGPLWFDQAKGYPHCLICEREFPEDWNQYITDRAKDDFADSRRDGTLTTYGEKAMSDTSILTEYDFIAMVDASGSMGSEDAPNGRSRWAYMQETAEAFCRDIQKLDSDGIGLVVFGGSQIDSYDGVTVDKVGEVFRSRSPRGSTPLAEALTSALKLAGKSNKKDFIICFTDGVPDDQDAVARVIREASNKQDSDDALTILFVQVGRDQAATAYLKKLDDNISGCRFDIVDAKTIDEAEKFATTTDLILAAIND
jgi:Mg-chelatase subunit ChlD